MKKIILIVIGIVLLGGCGSTIDSSLKAQVPKEKAQKVVSLYIATQQGCRSTTPTGGIWCREYIDDIKQGAKQQGYNVVDDLRNAEYVLLLTNVNIGGDWDAGAVTSGLMAAFSFSIVPVVYPVTAHSTFNIVKPNDLTHISKSTAYLKEGTKRRAYTSKFEWTRADNMFGQDDGNKELSKRSHDAMVVTTRKALSQMEEEYIFDEI